MSTGDGVPDEPTEESRAASERYARHGEPSWDAMAADALMSALAPWNPSGTTLVAECRTGRLMRRVAREFDGLSRVMAVDAERDLLDFARATVVSLEHPPVFFNQQSLPSLQFANDVFDVSLTINGIVTTAQLFNTVSELARVTAADGLVGIAAFGGNSARVFDELVNEAMWAAGGESLAARIDEVRSRRVRLEDFAEAAERVGVTVLASGVVTADVRFGRGSELLAHPVLERDVLPQWKAMGSASEALLQDVAARAHAYWGPHRIDDQVEVVWAVMRVDSALALDVDDVDVVEVDALRNERG